MPEITGPTATAVPQGSHSESHTRDRPMLGVAMLMGCLLLMTAITAVVKLMAEGYSIQQLLFFRFLFAALPFLILLPRNGGVALLRTRRPLDHAIRSGAGIVALAMYFYAIATIPVADATALSYAAPVFIVVLSIPFLGEQIGVRRWAAVAAGFIGMLLIARPGGVAFEWGYAAAIGSGFFGAMVSVWLRRLAPTERTMTIAIYYNCAGALIYGAWTMIDGWTTPDATDLALLILLGLLASPQQYLFAGAYRFAEASMLAPLDYTIMIFAAAVGYLFWAEIPALTTWIGCGIIAASGIFVAHRERVARRRT